MPISTKKQAITIIKKIVEENPALKDNSVSFQDKGTLFLNNHHKYFTPKDYYSYAVKVCEISEEKIEELTNNDDNLFTVNKNTEVTIGAEAIVKLFIEEITKL